MNRRSSIKRYVDIKYDDTEVGKTHQKIFEKYLGIVIICRRSLIDICMYS